MYILGISAFYHDSAAALIKDGELIAASMEERFSRKKHDNSFPQLAVEFCLDFAGITADDLEYVVFYEKPLVKFERILQTTINTFPRSAGVWREAMMSWLTDKLWVRSHIASGVGIPFDKVLFCDHHMSHAASTYFASPFKDAAIMTVDGVGEWTTTTLGVGKSSLGEATDTTPTIELFEEQRFPHSLGLLYSTFTAWLGFRVNNGEYKVMGMSPYGDSKYIDKIHKVISLDSSTGGFNLNMEYFDFHRSTQNSYSSKFLNLFGEKRDADAEFFTMRTNPERSAEKSMMDTNQYYADIAASIQTVTEDALISMATHLHHKTGMKKLVMAGGVALNTKANWRILNETPFDELWIQPAAGDDGGALGAALWVWHVVLGNPRRWTQPHAYYGKGYSDDECRQFLDDAGLKYETYNDEAKLTEVIVNELTQQNVIGFHQGRFEWGPRALGSRSIMADPRSPEMKEIVNTKIKYREPFRPFAPVIVRDRAPEYFDYPEVAEHDTPRYMLMVAPIKEEKQDEIHAVNHEGTGRLQSIDRETNQRYYDVVEQFGQSTGVPVVLNTSFNLRGEPIVNTPLEAFNTFKNSDIDVLVLGSHIVRKPL
jgi:carbamoyltransferase